MSGLTFKMWSNYHLRQCIRCCTTILRSLMKCSKCYLPKLTNQMFISNLVLKQISSTWKRPWQRWQETSNRVSLMMMPNDCLKKRWPALICIINFKISQHLTILNKLWSRCHKLLNKKWSKMNLLRWDRELKICIKCCGLYWCLLW